MLNRRTAIKLTMILIGGILFFNRCNDKQIVDLIVRDAENKVDIMVDGKLFTSYIHPDNLKKPVLWPLMSPAGNMVTRKYPLLNKAGERVDHRHHVGVWLNYGDVNGLDFWNNAETTPPEKRHLFGTVVHRSIEKAESANGEALLVTTADWLSPDNTTMLNEQTSFNFKAFENIRIIDRITTLKAVIEEVKFSDDKEGMFGIRVARELELPSDKPTKLTNANGEVDNIEKIENQFVTGNYRSSEGVEGIEVWGTRGRWMKLAGEIKGEQVALVIIDHPSNVGYPTYWHARDYGLFAANPLGQKIFSNGEKEMNFSLKKGESVTFKYRLIVAGENITDDQINKLADEYAKM